MSTFLLSQILIGIAFCFDLLSFQFKDRRHILLCFVCASLLIGVHFLLLDHVTAALLIFIAMSRFLTSYYTTKRRWMYLFLFITVAAFLLTYEKNISILAFAAGIFGTWASFQPLDRNLRLGMMIGTSLWIVHNVFAGSPAAVLLECFFLGSNFVGYYRFYLRTRVGGESVSVTVKENSINNVIRDRRT